MNLIRITSAALGSICLGVVLTAASCGGYVDPCASLASPTAQEKAVVATGAEIERELPNGTECELVGNVWRAERD